MRQRLSDRLIAEADTALRTLFATPRAMREPAEVAARAPAPLSDAARRESICLMRVNHCGEVCAQALYQGQAFVARDAPTRTLLVHAAQEERDHLAWCDRRVRDLGGQTSITAPLFYAGSFALGVVSGLLGDKWSMGFLVETERQVEAHLDDHLGRLDPGDDASRTIVETMRADEVRHGQSALERGAAELPSPIKRMMRGFSKVMTETTYRI
ncbi:MAG: 2-polyprenyl-3-methyl-6-methoxy-1,4-benzoquinone monooxygenase [Betaproteobacteria bacterium]|nr:2-polyprenyl-3-methyl-6-methoxy-1,4-benzoquinone monooxygenase [Betaproteobacteria bacterium]